jgi:hypothetical protein
MSIYPPIEITKDTINTSRWLRRVPNARYMCDHNMSALLKQGDQHRFDMYVEKSKFFNDTDDHEKKEKANYSAVYKKNPEFILSKVNAKEAEKKTEDPNALRKEVMTDPGRQTYDYERSGDQVDLVKNSVASYLNRYDRFFTPAQQMQ